MKHKPIYEKWKADSDLYVKIKKEEKQDGTGNKRIIDGSFRRSNRQEEKGG